MNKPNLHRRRAYYLDWLRCFAILLVFLFHCFKYFGTRSYHVSNSMIHPGFASVCDFVQAFGMPIFFLISGMAVALSSGNAQPKRLLRLVPALLGGILVFGPIQVFFEKRFANELSGSFWHFLPSYFDGWYGFGGNFAWMGLHLWYLMALLLFLLLSAPILPLFKRVPWHHWVDRGWFALIFVLPLIALESLLDLWPETWGNRVLGGWSIFSYFFFFLSGVILGTADPL